MKWGRRRKRIYFAANVLIARYKHGAIKLMMMIAHNEDYHELNPIWMEVSLRWWPIILAIEIKKEITAHPNLALLEFIYYHSLSIKINDYIDYLSQFFRVNFISIFRHVCMNKCIFCHVIVHCVSKPGHMVTLSLTDLITFKIGFIHLVTFGDLCCYHWINTELMHNACLN